MRELAGERGADIVDDFAGPHRQELAAEPAGREAERDIDEPVDDEEPHRREVPEQPSASPSPSEIAGGNSKPNRGDAL